MSKNLEFATNIDLRGNEIKNVAIENASVEPPATDESAAAGLVKYYGGTLYIGTGSGWTKLGQATTADGIATRVGALETWQSEADDKIDANATKAANNETAISGLGTRLGTAEGKIATAEGKIATLEGEMDTAQQDINALEVIVSGADGVSGLEKAVADNTAAIKNLASANNVYTKAEIDTKVTTINTEIGKKLASEDAAATYQPIAGMTSYYKKTETLSTQEIETKIATATSSIYNIKGSCKYGELPTSGQVKGDTWNITEAFSHTSAGEAVAKPYPAGTNVVWTGTEWDPLGGTVNLAPYATTDALNEQVGALQGQINNKVENSTYNSKISSIEGTIATLATTEALNTGLENKVDKTTYTEDKAELETSIGQKVTANAAITGRTKCKITYDSKGLVTDGADLTADDLPDDIPVSKLSGLDTAVKAVRFMHNYTAGTSQVVEHGLDIAYPHVSVFNTTTGAVIYAEVIYTNPNTITINGNVDLGSITVVVSP